MLTIWRCVSPSIPDHNYSYGPVWTATSATVAAVRGCYNKCTTTRDIMMPITAPIIAATIVVPLLLLRLLLLYKTPR